LSTLGKSIEKARLQKNMSRKALAKKIGMSERNILEIETGSKIVNSALLTRISKILGADIVDNQFGLVQETEIFSETKDTYKHSKKVESTSHNVISAFGNLIYSINVYDYSLLQVFDHISLPLENGKIEGHQKEKIAFIKITNQEMSGFRLCQDDTLLIYKNSQIKDDKISLIRYKNEYILRKIKKLTNDSILLIHHDGTLKSRKVSINEIEILGHAIKNLFYL